VPGHSTRIADNGDQDYLLDLNSSTPYYDSRFHVMSKKNPPKGSLKNPTFEDIEKAFLEDFDPLLAQSLYKKAKVKKEERGAFDLLYAKILRWFNRPNEAFELVAEAMKAAAGSSREEAACMLLRGLVLNDILKSVSAIKSFEEALGVLGREDDDLMRVEILMSLGLAQSNLGRQGEAKENLDRALELAGMSL